MIEVAEIGVQPAEAVEQPMMDRLVADALREREPLGERPERLVVVAFAGQRQPAHETTEQQRQEQAALARQRQTFGLKTRRLAVVADPVAQQPGDRQRE